MGVVGLMCLFFVFFRLDGGHFVGAQALAVLFMMVLFMMVNCRDTRIVVTSGSAHGLSSLKREWFAFYGKALPFIKRVDIWCKSRSNQSVFQHAMIGS